jgi:uncharacterized protein YndB with AHSA1/START domain
MRTNLTTARAETRSVTIAATPAAVLRLVGDPLRLPEWAPRFARAVEPQGEHWLVDDGANRFAIDVRVAPEHGTVDLVSPADPTRGAFSRVVHNADGAEYLFTLFFPDGTEQVAIDEQMATVEEELEAVRALVEAEAAA